MGRGAWDGGIEYGVDPVVISAAGQVCTSLAAAPPPPFDRHPFRVNPFAMLGP